MYPLKLMQFEAKKLGLGFIKHYGVRAFFYNGDVFGITTNDKWNNYIHNKEFAYYTKNHYYDELDFIISNKNKYILRSEGLADNHFLKTLVELEMCNGLGVYTKNKSGIVGYYFTINQQSKKQMHFCINKMHLFKNISKHCRKTINRSGILEKCSYLPLSQRAFAIQ